MRHGLRAVLLLGLLAATTCGGGASPPAAGEGLVLVAAYPELTEGFTLDLQVRSSGSEAGSLIWSSGDVRTASVDQQGQVLGCAPGNVTITARCSDTSREGTIDLQVVPDANFNRQLPRDASPHAPRLQRTCTVDRCEVSLQMPKIAASIARGRYRYYHRLELPRAGILGDEGKPELPFYTMYFAVPVEARSHSRARWTVSVDRTSPREYAGIRPWPHQPPWGIEGDPEQGSARSPFVVDESAYEVKDAWPKPTHWVEAVQIGNLSLLQVNVVPAVYRPAEGVLQLFQTIRVSVDFEGDGPLALPHVVGDYKGIGERSADELVSDYVQNRDLIHSVGAADLVAKLAPPDLNNQSDWPFDLLIVTRPALLSSAQRLAEYRQGEGTRVWLANLDEATFPDADSILELIRFLDDENRLEDTEGFRPQAMRAVLLFGDVEHIPTLEGMNMYGRADPGAGDEPVPVTGSDLGYSTLRGEDEQADVALGRISVDDVYEGDAVLSKIQDYEGLASNLNPQHMSIYSYFDDVPEERGLVCGKVLFRQGSNQVQGSGTRFEGQVLPGDVVRPFPGDDADEGRWRVRVREVVSDTLLELEQDWPVESAYGGWLQIGFQDGQDDWRFLRAAEHVRDFVTDLGVEVHFGYARNDEPAPAPLPAFGYDGDALPPELLECGWECEESVIQTRWGEGLDGIVLHSNHGRPDGWNHPRFRSWHLVPIDTSSGPWYPIVLSVNCSSGYFDSETDQVRVWDSGAGRAESVDNTPAVSDWSHHDECFCEEVLRKQLGGGVAAIGASRSTSSAFNEALIYGLFNALYAEYTRGVILDGPGSPPACEYLGDAVRRAKLVMHDWTASPTGGNAPTSAEYQMEAYHLFGDPMLRFRPPQPLSED